MRDTESGNSKGFAFINFGSFDSSDAAIEAMNGQHLCNRQISISYAFKKDAKGERHGSAAGEIWRLNDLYNILAPIYFHSFMFLNIKIFPTLNNVNCSTHS